MRWEKPDDIIKENKALVFQRNEVKKKIKYCNIDSNKYLSISPKRQNNELEKIKSQRQRSSSQINSERENKNIRSRNTRGRV